MQVSRQITFQKQPNHPPTTTNNQNNTKNANQHQHQPPHPTCHTVWQSPWTRSLPARGHLRAAASNHTDDTHCESAFMFTNGNKITMTFESCWCDDVTPLLEHTAVQVDGLP